MIIRFFLFVRQISKFPDFPPIFFYVFLSPRVTMSIVQTFFFTLGDFFFR